LSGVCFLVDQILDFVKPLWVELKDPTKKASKLIKTKESISIELERIKEQKEAAKNDKTLLKQITSKEKELKVQEKELKSKETSGPKFDRRYIEKYIFIYMNGYIGNPSFTGQRKDEIDSPDSVFAGYKIPEAKLREFWDGLRPLLEFDIFAKEASQKTTRTKKHVKAKKYSPAKLITDPKRKHETTFIICEGDSASGTIDKMITSGECKNLDYDHCALFSIGGVPMNARKEISVKMNPLTGEHVKIRSKRLRENERLTSMVQILNLDYTKTYATQEERDTLTYGSILIAADQDEDGKGNIRSQILNFFVLFWPELVKHMYVGFLVTPIVRAFHVKGKLKVQEFVTERDYKSWAASVDQNEWEIVYYKGLGSHGDREIEHMAKNFDSLKVIFFSDEKTEPACDVYFGENPDLRKVALRHPPKKNEEEKHGMKRSIVLRKCI
jgi:DNA gyrase/topoisomerase IV subunit B